MVTDVHETYYGNYFAMCTNIELRGIPEINIMLYISYTSIKNTSENKVLYFEGKKTLKLCGTQFSP